MFGMQHKILVVDDEESILFAMSAYFMTHGYQVDCAREMQEAEALLATVRYSVVIADLRLSELPSTEGIEIVRYVHERCPSSFLGDPLRNPHELRRVRGQGVSGTLTPLPSTSSAGRRRSPGDAGKLSSWAWWRKVRTFLSRDWEIPAFF